MRHLIGILLDAEPQAYEPGVTEMDICLDLEYFMRRQGAGVAFSSIVVSGDTTPDENLARAAKGADVLVHEGLSPEMVAILRDATAAAGHPRQSKIFHDIPGYHTSPVDAARVANEAGVKLLVFSHIIPMLPDRFAERLFLRGVSDVRPEGVRLGHDGDVLRLPGHSAAIEERSLN